ncbi:hypothetical protein [Brachyspira murdochii]|uniref:hypothetical protein n=1 Tax=Brachyspira murdochii TaxID=84378 RepID=UPI003F686CF5
MKYLDKLKQILNEPVTVDKLNMINYYFIRICFLYCQHIALNFINAIFRDLNFETFKKI